MIALCLLLLAAADPGGWTVARWGMSPDQILAAIPGAVRLEHPEKLKAGPAPVGGQWWGKPNPEERGQPAPGTKGVCVMSWIAESDHGDIGQPGSGYTRFFAGIKRASAGQYEIHVRSVWGSNQGCLEEHGRIQRRYRAATLDELLRVAISEVRADSELADSVSFLCAAIRDAVFDAQDAEAKIAKDRAA
jgi:hypothetical protein